MSSPVSLEMSPGPVLLPTPEVVQAQQLLAQQQLAVAIGRARAEAGRGAVPAGGNAQPVAVLPR
ncbi:hypothetical protein RZA67_11725 [Stenotrophomonas sp. C3(2023)]|uniref:hypothetical protein n=1 Tax=Stenotrophomonas sp. C3(2023) TaxID=3080277 RepID=UPI00293CC94E|nr:hypothetical protein [Stenotrophomonas sp. C3(2023)]MDV3469390.1 hypothetical protein [Stenotrophomonas sp. C3(2023)]